MDWFEDGGKWWNFAALLERDIAALPKVAEGGSGVCDSGRSIGVAPREMGRCFE
jgi:hypothetical protein